MPRQWEGALRPAAEGASGAEPPRRGARRRDVAEARPSPPARAPDPRDSGRGAAKSRATGVLQRPRTAFEIFSAENKSRIQSAFDRHLWTVVELRRAVNKAWAELPPDEVQDYKLREERERQHFARLCPEVNCAPPGALPGEPPSACHCTRSPSHVPRTRVTPQTPRASHTRPSAASRCAALQITLQRPVAGPIPYRTPACGLHGTT